MIFFINIDILTEKYPAFNQSDSTLFGCIFVGSGCLGCFISGYFLSKYPKFQILSRSTAFLHLLAYTTFVFTLQFYQNRILTAIQIGIVGFINISVQPIALEFAAEATYPVSETYSCGMLITTVNIISIPIVTLIGYLVDHTEMYIAQSPGIAVSFIAFVLTLFIKEDLRRLNQDLDFD